MNRIIWLFIGLVVGGSALAILGWKNLDEHAKAFTPIFPDGIQVYGDASIKDTVKVALTFNVNEGTRFRSSFDATFDFVPNAKHTHTFAVAMPYHVDWIQNRDPPNAEGKERWDFSDDPSGGSLIVATFTPNAANKRATISGYFGLDEPMAVQDRGKYTAIIPIHLTSNVIVPFREVERLDRVPTTITVSIPEKSIPGADSFPHPDQIVLREEPGRFRTKGMIWFFNFSKSTEPGQTVLASYILPDKVDEFRSKLFWAGLLLGVGIPTAISGAVELVKHLSSSLSASTQKTNSGGAEEKVKPQPLIEKEVDRLLLEYQRLNSEVERQERSMITMGSIFLPVSFLILGFSLQTHTLRFPLVLVSLALNTIWLWTVQFSTRKLHDVALTRSREIECILGISVHSRFYEFRQRSFLLKIIRPNHWIIFWILLIAAGIVILLN